MNSASKSVLNSPHCPPIYPTLSKLTYKDVTEGSIKSLVEVTVHKINYSSLIYLDVHDIIESGSMLTISANLLLYYLLASRISCFIIFPEAEMRLTGL